MISKAFVYIDGLDTSPVICGVTEINTQKKMGRFRYGKSYLARPDAFALDPVHLPLSENQYQTKVHNGIFGVLSDAGADSWGEKVILSLHKTVPKNRLEFLLAGSGMGVGALVFSLSSSSSKPKYNKNNLGDIPVLLKAKDAILADQSIPEEAKKAFEFGSSMGGARPKTIIQDADTAFLAKFNRPDDLYNTVKVEHATMKMLAELPCKVAKTKTLNTPTGDVLLVERFDIENSKPKCHFLSANSIFSLTKINEGNIAQQYSYGALAEFIMKYVAEPSDTHDLYYRMVFNVLIGNTDDHARNHAMTYDFSHMHWRLSPAYDVLPINASKQHAIAIGEHGRFASIENLLSQSKRFGLKPFKAQKIIAEVTALVSEWPSYFSRFNVGDGDIERLGFVFPKF